MFNNKLVLATSYVFMGLVVGLAVCVAVLNGANEKAKMREMQDAVISYTQKQPDLQRQLDSLKVEFANLKNQSPNAQ